MAPIRSRMFVMPAPSLPWPSGSPAPSSRTSKWTASVFPQLDDGGVARRRRASPRSAAPRDSRSRRHPRSRGRSGPGSPRSAWWAAGTRPLPPRAPRPDRVRSGRSGRARWPGSGCPPWPRSRPPRAREAGWRPCRGRSLTSSPASSSSMASARQPLLGAVVKIPLDPPALLVGRRHDAAPRSLELPQRGAQLRFEALVLQRHLGEAVRHLGHHRCLRQRGIVDQRRDRHATAPDLGRRARCATLPAVSTGRPLSSTHSAGSPDVR